MKNGSLLKAVLLWRFLIEKDTLDLLCSSTTTEYTLTTETRNENTPCSVHTHAQRQICRKTINGPACFSQPFAAQRDASCVCLHSGIDATPKMSSWMTLVWRHVSFAKYVYCRISGTIVQWLCKWKIHQFCNDALYVRARRTHCIRCVTRFTQVAVR